MNICIITNSNEKTNEIRKKKKINCLTFPFFSELFFQKKWKKNWHLNFCMNRFLKKKNNCLTILFFCESVFEKKWKKNWQKTFFMNRKKNEKKYWQKSFFMNDKIFVKKLTKLSKNWQKIVKKLTPAIVKKITCKLHTKWNLKKRQKCRKKRIFFRIFFSASTSLGLGRRPGASKGLAALSFFKTASSNRLDFPQFSLFCQLYRPPLPSVSISLPVPFLEGTGPYQVG